VIEMLKAIREAVPEAGEMQPGVVLSHVLEALKAFKAIDA
jgi:hypothetical protein